MWRFLKKLEIELPYDPAIPLLGIHTEETRSERDTCTPVFIAALFIIARTWKQPRCSSADEWIRKLWYMYTMEYYSAVKKNSFESVLMGFLYFRILYECIKSHFLKKYSYLSEVINYSFFIFCFASYFPSVPFSRFLFYISWFDLCISC